ncbi:MAG: hypothetical protein CEN89_124 [Candidatus Berkelbacteria bacterium Licking1014_7]|uniref:DUF881 domain-containing protein n=1 Tax=Candidatus Berkelbacteria bacterium Licking1014_7 TaxID=2017147 RepID=A0A554LKF7_9BACT|nr:MAG: hypothetical protein CEN89_124 [Candidatus Berkelbacteria bacterium Licking1014_7]
MPIQNNFKQIFPVYLSLFAVSIILGYGIIMQVNVKAKLQETIDPKKTSVIALEVAELIKDNRALLSEQKELQEQRDKLFAGTSEKEESLAFDLEKYKIVTGITKVQGQGVEIKIEKFLQTVQIIDIVNALRNIGIEAMSVNGQRIVVNTGITEENFSPPYTILAIGDARVLENALTRKGGIIEQIGAQAKVEIKENIDILAKI